MCINIICNMLFKIYTMLRYNASSRNTTSNLFASSSSNAASVHSKPMKPHSKGKCVQLAILAFQVPLSHPCMPHMKSPTLRIRSPTLQPRERITSERVLEQEYQAPMCARDLELYSPFPLQPVGKPVYSISMDRPSCPPASLDF